MGPYWSAQVGSGMRRSRLSRQPPPQTQTQR